MFNLEKDSNRLRITAVLILIILGSLAFYFNFYQNWSIPTVFNLVGIGCNWFGTLWIASGVYLSSTEKNHLKNGNSSRNKSVKQLANSLVSASKVIPIGVIYILFGGIFQALVLVGSQLQWF